MNTNKNEEYEDSLLLNPTEATLSLLKDEIRQLEEMLELKQANYKRIKELVKNTDNCGNQSNPESETITSEIDKLLPEILTHIFNYCENEEILDFRLVCKNWKHTIDNCPKLLGRFIINIYNWNEFIKSTIVNQAKAIRIYKSWCKFDLEDENNWLRLQLSNELNEIDHKIVFDIQNHDLDSKQGSMLIISWVLLCCTGINELYITNMSILQSLATLYELNNQSIAITNKNIKIFGIDFYVTINEDPEVLKKILGHFPNLIELRINTTPKLIIMENTTIKSITEFVMVNKSLKEIKLYFENCDYCLYDDLETMQLWFKFLFTIRNLGIKIIFPEEFKLNGNILLEYNNETIESPLNNTTCDCFQIAELDFKNEIPNNIEVKSKKLGFCTNITSFKIKFYRNVKFQELLFLQKLKNLESLVLMPLIDTHYEQEQLEEDTTPIFPIQIFDTCNFLSLLSLEIYKDLFGPNQQSIEQVFASFFLNFPNLKTINLNDLEIIPAHIFVHLSKLELLEELDISWLKEHVSLTDEMFTELCESQRPGRIELVPAVTAFNKLSYLSVFRSKELTDICFVEGISKSQTLTRVSMSFVTNGQFKIDSFIAMQNANFKEEFIRYYNEPLMKKFRKY